LQDYSRAPTGLGSDFKPSAGQPHSFAHVFQTIARSDALVRPVDGKSLAVIFDLEVESDRGQLEPHPDLPRARVFENIVDRFLRRQENMMP
jgi:hypothetical protein